MQDPQVPVREVVGSDPVTHGPHFAQLLGAEPPGAGGCFRYVGDQMVARVETYVLIHGASDQRRHDEERRRNADSREPLRCLEVALPSVVERHQDAVGRMRPASGKEGVGVGRRRHREAAAAPVDNLLQPREVVALRLVEGDDSQPCSAAVQESPIVAGAVQRPPHLRQDPAHRGRHRRYHVEC